MPAYERICSLLPSATEIVCALGLGDKLLAVTHECDYPAEVAGKPRATYSRIKHETMSTLEIDIAVDGQLAGEGTLYMFEEGLLDRLQPDLILTQELCDVCAVSFDRVLAAANELTSQPRVVSLDPHHFQDILDNVRIVAALTGTEDRADALLTGWYERIGRVAAAAATIRNRPKVALLEWLNPAWRSGHWNPEVVALAGGVDGLGNQGSNASRLDWQEVLDYNPDVVVIAQCGFGLERSLSDVRGFGWPEGWQHVRAARDGQIYIVDGNSYFSRPGPRIIDSLEIMAEILHPGLFAGLAPAGSYVRLGTTL